MKYKTIGFDWGGVIFGEPGPVFSKEAAQLLEVSHEEFKKIYFKHNKLINIENILAALNSKGTVVSFKE